MGNRLKQRDIGFIQGMACAIGLVRHIDGLDCASHLYHESNIPLEEFERYAQECDVEIVREAAAY